MITHSDNKTDYIAFDCQNPSLKLPDTEKYKIHLPKIKRTYQRNYSLTSVILMFFIFSFIGWSWEVVFHLLTDKSFANRGMLFGPWLPIYGFGGTLTLFIPKKISKNPVKTFVVIAILSTIIEYITSWYLEYTRNIRWWDYSEYALNINGRVCLIGSVVFGIGGCFAIYYLGPLLDDMIKKIPHRIAVTVSVILLSFFIADMVYSKFNPNIGKGITDYSKSVVISINYTSYCNNLIEV